MARTPRSRIRQRLDVRRLGVAVSYPGIDPRIWLAYGRVDDDADAVRWDSALGWLADVTLLGGGVDQEGATCRMGQVFGADQQGSFQPLVGGELVVVLVPEGDLNVAPVIVGMLASPDLPVPGSVNGQTIDEDFAKAAHILVTEKNVQQEVGEKWRTSATSRATLEAPEVRLANEDADQDFVRGNDYADAEGQFLDALTTFLHQISDLATPAPPNGALTVATVIAATQGPTGLLAAVQQFKDARNTYLSTKIKGE